MTCRDIDDLLGSGPGNPAASPDAFEHMARCADCRILVNALFDAENPSAPPEIQLRRIETSIAGNLKPVRPLPHSRLFLFVCAIVFVSIVAIGATPFGMNGWGALSLLQRTAVFVTLAASAVLLAISMIGQMVPGSKYAFAPVMLPIGILAALLIAIAAAFDSREEPGFLANGLGCIKNGLSYAIPAAFLFWLLVRRGAILYPKLIGASVGGLAGLIGLSVLEINCSNLNVFHILMWHWGVVLISSAAGPMIGAVAERIEWSSRNGS